MEIRVKSKVLSQQINKPVESFPTLEEVKNKLKYCNKERQYVGDMNIFTETWDVKDNIDINKYIVETDKVTVSNCNLFNIHLQVLRKLQQEKSTLFDLQKQILKCNETIESASCYEIERRMAIKTKKELEDKIEILTSDKEKYEYLERVYEILEEFKQMLLTPTIKDIDVNKKELRDKNLDYVKTTLISQYILIAKDYISIDVEFEKEISCECPVCNKVLSEDDQESGICNNCHIVCRTLDNLVSYKDSENIINNLKESSTSDNSFEHFKDVAMDVQGKHNHKLDDGKALKAIDDYCSRMSKSRKQLEIEEIDKILSTANPKLTANYKDRNLLYSICTGNPLPDFSQIQEEMFQEHKELYTVWAQTKEEGRRNFPPAHFVLRLLLNKHKFHVDPKFINEVRTDGIHREHNDTMRICFAKLREKNKGKGWDFQSTI
jgi:hypothetical protein